MDLEQINKQFKEAEQTQDIGFKVARLDNLIKETSSSDLPQEIKDRVISKCASLQVETISSLNLFYD